VEYFVNNYRTSVFNEINYTLSFNDESRYDIITVDSKWFSFGDDGVLIDMEFDYVEEADLPSAVSSFISTHFPNKEISEIYYYSYDSGSDEGYDIYFADGLNIEFGPSGEVLALYGDNILHLPLPIRNYVQTNYPNENLLYCSFNVDGYQTWLGPEEMVEHEWDLYFEANLWLGLNLGLNFVYTFGYEIPMSNLIAPVEAYFATNYPGETTVYELSHYFSPTYGESIYFVALYYDTFFVFDETGSLLDQYVASSKKVAQKIKREKPVSMNRAIKKEMNKSQ